MQNLVSPAGQLFVQKRIKLVFKIFNNILVQDKKIIEPFYSNDYTCNSPYWLPYNSYYVSWENLVLDRQILPLIEIFSLFSSLVCLILYCYCEEKFCLGHSWECEG